MDNFLYFSFIQGVVAFFAPCAVALLPAYIASFVSKEDDLDSNYYLFYRGLKLASLSILGILLVYAIAGLLIVVASQVIKQYMKWVALGMGAVLVVLGVLQLLGRKISLDLNISHGGYESEVLEAFVFGIAYAIGALGCLFPLFLIVATQALVAPTVWLGGAYIFAYFAGISIVMIVVIVASTFAKDFIARQIRKVLPYMQTITGVLLILAGVYVIQYQWVLL